MLEFLERLDASLLLFLNGINSAFFDEVFWLITGKFSWLPMIGALLFCMFRRDWKSGLLTVVAIALTITLCDQISSSIIKDSVCRFRPTHNPDIAGLVHVVNDYRGGKYGFVSSHAANSFGVAMLLSLIFRNRAFSWTIFSWAAILSYSRIYLGVHYPGDILCGGVLGILLGALVYWLYERVLRLKVFSAKDGSNASSKDARILVCTSIGNILLLFVAAIIIYAVK